MSDAGQSPKLAGMKYVVESILHNDGPTTVMLVNDPGALSKRYAVKVIKREDEKQDGLLARAEASAEASAKLNHPGVVSTHDYRPIKAWFKVARGEQLMDYVAGKSIDQVKGLNVGQCVLIFRQMAAALAHMHRRKVLHGDLEPGHVMLTRTGQIKLLNYGAALVPSELRPGPNRAFAAPEVVRENRILEPSDVYSLGAIMYQLLTGRPFAAPKGKAGEDDAVKIPNPSAINVKVPTALSNLVVSCLNRHAPKRIASPYDVLQQVEPMVDSMKLDDEMLVGLTAAQPD